MFSMRLLGQLGVAAIILTAVLAVQVNAAEYFVNKQGDDANDGVSRRAAFLTIQKGVDALEPGDTLTIAPGEYREAVALIPELAEEHLQ